MGNRKKKKKRKTVALRKRRTLEKKVVDLQLTINLKSSIIH